MSMCASFWNINSTFCMCYCLQIAVIHATQTHAVSHQFAWHIIQCTASNTLTSFTIYVAVAISARI